MDYDPTWRNKAPIRKANRAVAKPKNDDKADWTPAWVLSPAHVVYVWHAPEQGAPW